MTIPHLSNCEHQSAGWCLHCVRDLYSQLETLQGDLNDCKDHIAFLHQEIDCLDGSEEYGN